MLHLVASQPEPSLLFFVFLFFYCQLLLKFPQHQSRTENRDRIYSGRAEPRFNWHLKFADPFLAPNFATWAFAPGIRV